MKQIELWAGREITKFEDKLAFGEFNLEKWAKVLFTAASAGDPQLSRTFKKPLEQFVLDDDSPEHGALVRPFIEIIPPNNGERYSVDTHDVLYALYQQWEDAGRPLDAFKITLRRTAKLMGWSSGKKNLDRIKRALSTMYSTEVHFYACFEMSENAQGVDAKLKTKRFRILYDYDTEEDFQKGDPIYGTAKIAFHKDVLKSLLSGKRIPINFPQRMSIKHKLSRAVYGVYDTYLTSQYSKDPRQVVREIKIENLLSEFNQTEQKYKAKRKRVAETIAKHLDRAELSRGGLFMNVSARETADGKDYKLVFKVVGTATKKLQKVSYLHQTEMVNSLMIDASDIIGPIQQLDNRSMNALKDRIRQTPLEFVYSAISECREEINVKNRRPNCVPAYLIAIMKRKVQESKRR